MIGAIAQLGEHLLCTQGVGGSSPPGSTTFSGNTKIHSDVYFVVETFFKNLVIIVIS
jgi:hypothetical protein